MDAIINPPTTAPAPRASGAGTPSTTAGEFARRLDGARVAEAPSGPAQATAGRAVPRAPCRAGGEAGGSVATVGSAGAMTSAGTTGQPAALTDLIAVAEPASAAGTEQVEGSAASTMLMPAGSGVTSPGRIETEMGTLATGQAGLPTAAPQAALAPAADPAASAEEAASGTADEDVLEVAGDLAERGAAEVALPIPAQANPLVEGGIAPTTPAAPNSGAVPATAGTGATAPTPADHDDANRPTSRPGSVPRAPEPLGGPRHTPSMTGAGSPAAHTAAPIKDAEQAVGCAPHGAPSSPGAAILHEPEAGPTLTGLKAMGEAGTGEPAGPGLRLGEVVPSAPAERVGGTAAEAPALRAPEAALPVSAVPLAPAAAPLQAPLPAAPPVPVRAAPRAPPAQQVAPVAIALSLGGAGGGRLALQLDPVELGRVEIAVEKIREAATIHIAAERPETLALLARDSAALDRALGGAGVGAEGGRSMSFSLLSDGGGGAAQHGRQGGGGRRRASAEPIATQPVPERRALLGLLDMAL
ncbi:flagellar hook-length control protein FliK [Muricoccus radiodurans]|uniref:flagellar hook-length control protein FliK n=1 Tax=Muricoccus radiodurans TaxID=2231721 RepID=UPI003CFB9E81